MCNETEKFVKLTDFFLYRQNFYNCNHNGDAKFDETRYHKAIIALADTYATMIQSILENKEEDDSEEKLMDKFHQTYVNFDELLLNKQFHDILYQKLGELYPYTWMRNFFIRFQDDFEAKDRVFGQYKIYGLEHKYYYCDVYSHIFWDYDIPHSTIAIPLWLINEQVIQLLMLRFMALVEARKYYPRKKRGLAIYNLIDNNLIPENLVEYTKDLIEKVLPLINLSKNGEIDDITRLRYVHQARNAILY